MSVYCYDRILWEETVEDGILWFGSQIMHRPAWAVADVTDLWLNPTLRGNNLKVPGTPGRRIMPRRVDETKRSIPLVIDGRIAPGGTAHPEERAGLRSNVKYILNTVCNHGGTVQMTLWLPGAANSTGASTATVQVDNLQVGNKQGSLWLAVLDITIPGGSF